MVKVELGPKYFALPESWPDVIASGQYLAVVTILAFIAGRDRANRLSACEQIVKLYGGKALSAAPIPESEVIPSAMRIIEHCYPVLDFIFDIKDKDGNLLLLVDNPFPELVHEGVKYKGKGRYMSPMTGAEMEECSWAYAEYSKGGDIAMLDKVIEQLYTPEVPLSKGGRGISLATLPPIYKMGIKFWYESCETWWRLMHLKLYEEKSETDKAVDSLSISRMIRGIAGPKRGTVEHVRAMKRDEIYFELMELDREYEEAVKASK